MCNSSNHQQSATAPACGISLSCMHCTQTVLSCFTSCKTADQTTYDSYQKGCCSYQKGYNRAPAAAASAVPLLRNKIGLWLICIWYRGLEGCAAWSITQVVGASGESLGQWLALLRLELLGGRRSGWWGPTGGFGGPGAHGCSSGGGRYGGRIGHEGGGDADRAHHQI